MKIALIGYGKMGKEIEKIALERGHEIVLKINDQNLNDLTKENIAKADVAIEFTIPNASIENHKLCFEAGTPIVSGTTGWMDQFEAVKETCIKTNGGMFYASNFSLGVNIFFKLNAFLAKMMNPQKDYEVSMKEIHHTQKLDEPSGTAITIANGIIGNVERKEAWSLENKSDENIFIDSVRKDPYPGTHAVVYDSEIDRIEIQHEAKSRKGFALGSVLAAEFMNGKTGAYSMDDLLKF